MSPTNSCLAGTSECDLTLERVSLQRYCCDEVILEWGGP